MCVCDLLHEELPRRLFTEEDVEAALHELLYWMLDPKVIAGAISSCIDAHGPLTKAMTSSASKRVRGAMKTRAAECMKQMREERQEDDD